MKKKIMLIPAVCVIAVFGFILFHRDLQVKVLREIKKHWLMHSMRPRTFKYKGTKRTYLLHAPHADRAHPRRGLVIMLHGSDSDAFFAGSVADFESRADRDGVIVAYPNGTGDEEAGEFSWNAGNCCGSARKKNVDDSGFLAALAESLRTKYRIPPGQIYAAGFSNGGMMAYRLACEHSEIFSAAAVVAGALNVPCTPERPVSIIAFHGTDDPYVLYGGGISPADSEKSEDSSYAFAQSEWSRLNGCVNKPAESRKGNVTQSVYECPAGVEVLFFTLTGEGHVWPGGLGAVSYEAMPSEGGHLSADEEIWNFFKRRQSGNDSRPSGSDKKAAGLSA